MTQQHLLGIGDLSRKYNCSFRTLRFYEEKGLLAPLRVGQQRFYSAKDEIKLQLILRGKRLGLPLQEIQALILAKSEQTTIDQTRTEAIASLLPREKITDQIALLTDRRAGLDAALSELKKAQIRTLPVREEALS